MTEKGLIKREENGLIKGEKSGESSVKVGCCRLELVKVGCCRLEWCSSAVVGVAVVLLVVFHGGWKWLE